MAGADSDHLLRGYAWARLGAAALLLALGPSIPVELMPATNRSLLAVALVAVAVSSTWILLLPTSARGRRLRWSTCVLDAVLVTAVVAATGGGRSMFSFLYVLLVVAACLLLSRTGGVGIAGLCSALYIGVVFTRTVMPMTLVLEAPEETTALEIMTMFLNSATFLIVAIVAVQSVAAVGEQVRRVGLDHRGRGRHERDGRGRNRVAVRHAAPRVGRHDGDRDRVLAGRDGHVPRVDQHVDEPVAGVDLAGDRPVRHRARRIQRAVRDRRPAVVALLAQLQRTPGYFGVGEEIASSFPGITRLGGQVVAALFLLPSLSGPQVEPAYARDRGTGGPPPQANSGHDRRSASQAQSPGDDAASLGARPVGDTRPGWGCGDQNHEHTGPPGNPDAESPELLAESEKLGLEPILACSIVDLGVSPSDFTG